MSNNLSELKTELSKIFEYFIEDRYLDESGKLNEKYYYGVERAYSKTLVTVKGQIEVFKLMKNQVNYGFGEVTVK